MHPELFTLFGVTIKAYSFFTYLAMLAVFAGTLWLAGKRGLPKSKTAIALLVMAIGAFIGARLLHIFLNFGLYQANSGLVYSLDFRGFSLYGGLLMAAFLGFIVCRILKLDLWRLADSAAPFLGLGIALMRVGCFLNGCCFGKITSFFMGLEFPVLSQAHINQLSHGQANLFSVSLVHPVQIYELLAALVATSLAIYILKKNYVSGSAILSFVIFFTAWRWVSYTYFRVMPDTFGAPSSFYPFLYLGIIVICALVIWRRTKCSSFD